MWWYIIGLVWIALIGGIVWSYQRKKTRRDAEREKQFSELYANLKLNRPEAPAVPAASPLPSAEKKAEPVEPAPISTYIRKPRLLGQANALLYFVFRTGLPDHEIFANVPLGDAVEIAESSPGFEREQRARRLAQLKIDLLVCTRQLEIIAAVMLIRDEQKDDAQAQNDRFSEQCLREAGIRVLRLEPKALPRHHQVRELVYGAA